MYEGELAFEREILISGCLCDCSASIRKEGRMQRLGFLPQGSTGVGAAERNTEQTGISVCIDPLIYIQTLTTACPLLNLCVAHCV